MNRLLGTFKDYTPDLSEKAWIWTIDINKHIFTNIIQNHIKIHIHV